MARRTSASCASATGSTKSCIAYHTDKRALFLFEHAVGRESCVSCHDPLGSNNHAMLVALTPMLCQRCHIGTRRPSTIYDGAAIQARSIRIIGRRRRELSSEHPRLESSVGPGARSDRRRA